MNECDRLRKSGTVLKMPLGDMRATSETDESDVNKHDIATVIGFAENGQQGFLKA
jgi:hypothetical protein